MVVDAVDLMSLHDFCDDLAAAFAPLVAAHLEGEPTEAYAEQVISTIAPLLLHIQNLADPRPAKERHDNRP